MPSILRSLSTWAERCPDRLLYAFLDVEGRTTASYTYGQFVQRTIDIAAHVQRSHDLPAGARVLLAYPPGLEMICAFFACVRAGLVPVPVYPPTSHGFRAALTKMNFIARDCGAAAVMTERSYLWSMKLNQARERVVSFSLRREGVARLPWIVSTDAGRAEPHEVREAHSPLLFLQYTSGSTSDPKGVMVSHANIVDNGDAVVDHLPVGVSWLPQYHDMGLIGYYLFFAMKGGTTYGFSPLDFIRRPALWLETISKVRGTASSAPNFAYEYCLRPDKLPPETFDDLDLSSLRFLMTAAEPVRAEVYKAFLDRFAPHGLNPRSFFSAYGLAEHTLAATNYGRRTTHLSRARLEQDEAVAALPGEPVTTLVSCGRPVGETEVCIVEPDLAPATALPPGRVGEIWLRGPSTCEGYWGRPDQTAATFGARLEGDAGGPWLRTGDLGFLDQGELFICGRSKDLIIVRGLNYYPQDIELLVEETVGVRRGCVVAFGVASGVASGVTSADREQVVVVAEVKDPGRPPDARAIQQRVVQGLGVGIDTLVFVRPRSIPKTSSGKLVRHLARTQHLAGSLAVVQTASPGQAVPVVEASPSGTADVPPAFAEILHRFGLSGAETWTLAEAGLDSIQLVDFAEALRAHLRDEGHAELARSVDLRVLQKVAICELIALLAELATAASHARLRFKRHLGALGEEHRALEQELMRRDARLNFDPRHLPQVHPGESTTPGTTLLTGGTGFLGPFLLASLLQQRTGPISVLVRADSEAHGLARLRDGLRTLRLPGGLPDAWASRVRPVLGDLGRVNLGLSTSRWAELAESVDTIFHNGAEVHYLRDYAAMRDVNVGGTHEIVRLAMSHRPAVLNHVSTTFIFGWSTKETLFETDANAEMALLDFGYSQTKWVAEQVVADAMAQGLAGRIFRPALITPSVTGGGENLDISIRLLSFMLKHRLGTTAANQVSFSPADTVADNIVAIAAQPESLGHTLHITRDDYARMADITALMGQLTQRAFTDLPLSAFVPAVIERCGPDDALYPLLDFFVRSIDHITAMEFKRYDNASFRRFRDASPWGRADPPLADVVLGLLRFMVHAGLTDGWTPESEAS